MSITPLPAGTAALPAAPADLAGGAPGDGSFAALVATLLGQPAGGAAGSPVPVAGTPAPAGDLPGDVLAGEQPEDPADATDTAPAADGTAVVAPVWTPVLDGLVPVVQPGAAETGAPDATTAAPVAAAGEAAMLPAAASYDATATPETATSPTPDLVPAATTDSATGLRTVGNADGATPDARAAVASPDPATAAPSTAPTTGPAAPVAVPATPSAVPDGAARPAPVVSQVVPEVTRLVSRGDGVHRLTMRLQPEGLGDVRVTLTVRDGQVDVRLAAGDDARRALVEGAPELRRVLELTGATEARVVVRDLAGSVTPSGQQAWTATGQQAGQQDSWTTGAHGGGGDASGRGDAGGQGQHAGTRGGAAARDGHSDGATVLRPDPSGGAPRGVDLTM